MRFPILVMAVLLSAAPPAAARSSVDRAALVHIPVAFGAAWDGGVAGRLKALEAEGGTGSDEYARLVERFYDAYLINMANAPAFSGASAHNILGGTQTES